jgi:hypothetical protein
MSEDEPRREALRRLYESTEYWVDDAPDGAFSIRCFEKNAALDRLLAVAGRDDWIYITACNPGSRQLPDEENARRMAELEMRLRLLPCVLYRGRGVGALETWPPEPSFLVLGLDERQGLELGNALGQAAIVVGRRGEASRLAWCDR